MPFTGLITSVITDLVPGLVTSAVPGLIKRVVNRLVNRSVTVTIVTSITDEKFVISSMNGMKKKQRNKEYFMSAGMKKKC